MSGWGLACSCKNVGWHVPPSALLGIGAIGTFMFILAWPAKAHGSNPTRLRLKPRDHRPRPRTNRRVDPRTMKPRTTRLVVLSPNSHHPSLSSHPCHPPCRPRSPARHPSRPRLDGTICREARLRLHPTVSRVVTRTRHRLHVPGEQPVEEPADYLAHLTTGYVARRGLHVRAGHD